MWQKDYFEKTLRRSGFDLIAGVDEVGRGALAGPVMAAAVMLDGKGDYGEIRDSKVLSPNRRERLAEWIGEAAVGIGIGSVDECVIDEINILQATHEAMRRAIANLPIIPEVVLVDGFWLPGLEPQCIGVIKGDACSYSIAAASIIAKVERDGYMESLALEHPQYGLDRNKGYGTGFHRDAIAEYGPSSCHRKSFGGVGELQVVGGSHGH
jgi:ribonuclease HII